MTVDMIRATLAGIKTETRRPDLGCNKKHDAKRPCTCLDWSKAAENCPYGRPGDRLYVRETHYRWGKWVKCGKTKTGRQMWRFKHTVEAAGFERDGGLIPAASRTDIGWHKRPSIFLPKKLARIWLEITNVKLEHLQSITEKQAIAEGMRIEDAERQAFWTPVSAFARLWNELYAKRLDRHGIPGGYSWAINPVVWRICFRRITP